MKINRILKIIILILTVILISMIILIFLKKKILVTTNTSTGKEYMEEVTKEYPITCFIKNQTPDDTYEEYYIKNIKYAKDKVVKVIDTIENTYKDKEAFDSNKDNNLYEEHHIDEDDLKIIYYAGVSYDSSEDTEYGINDYLTSLSSVGYTCDEIK